MAFANVAAIEWIADPYVNCSFNYFGEVLVFSPHYADVLNSCGMTCDVMIDINRGGALRCSLNLSSNVLSESVTFTSKLQFNYRLLSASHLQPSWIGFKSLCMPLNVILIYVWISKLTLRLSNAGILLSKRKKRVGMWCCINNLLPYHLAPGVTYCTANGVICGKCKYWLSITFSSNPMKSCCLP